jgi:hypothetical protein
MPGLPSPPDHLHPTASSLPRHRLRSVSLTVEHPERWAPNPTPSTFELTLTLDENGTTASILSPRGRQLVEWKSAEREAEKARERAIKQEERQRKEKAKEEEKKRVYESLTHIQQLHWSLSGASPKLYYEWLDRVLDPYERFEGGLWMFDGH